MIDYWEAIGRLITYKDLNDELLSILPPPGAIPFVTAPVQGVGTAPGLNIPQSEYEAVQGLFSPILTEGYLSLMGAGELIWTYRFQETRDAVERLHAIVTQTQPELFGPSTRYFITLGILVLDEIFRHSLQKREPTAVTVLERLSALQNDKITNLANNPEFEKAALAFCKLPWAGGCNSFLRFWEGHLHPLGINAAGTWQPGEEKSTSTTGQDAKASAAYNS